jgi:asparagine synthase (glutamine-hydrolysing)
MCGICGVFHFDGQSPASDVLQAMTDSLHHRGPDGEGIYISGPVGLGHRRLSIIDLSAAGAQPMNSAGERYVITYNGEIYNFQVIRRQLEAEGYPFRGHSDTEVLLGAIERWGLHRAIESVHGMFAFAIWDRDRRELYLARDRVGKKPLYYGWCGDVFLFASELKALRVHPEFDGEIDRRALSSFIQYGWISEPLSIYRNIHKLQPGSVIKVSAKSQPWAEPEQHFWSSRQAMERARSNIFTGSFEEACDRLDTLLNNSVLERMVADVDLGALLSGGIDSSVIVGIMQRHSDRPVKTFTIGFEEKKYNEAEYASAIAKYLGTDHYELHVTPQQCLDVVSSLPDMYDEPFGDVSQVPTFLVAQLARQQVKVVLSGDGGDETFAGYKHYPEGLASWSRLASIPHGLRNAAAEILTSIGDASWHLLRPHKISGAGKMPAWRKFGGKLQRKTRYWRATCPQSLLAAHFSRTHRPELLVVNGAPGMTNMVNPEAWSQSVDDLSAMLQFDYAGYMVGDVLVKVDRATMAVGLEARCPILDSGIAEFAWSLPRDYLLDKQGGKKVLKGVLERYVPREFTERPKRGFGVPIDTWLKGPLRDWMEDLISEPRIAQHGCLDFDAVRHLWDQHMSGWRNHSNILWSIAMFQIWFDRAIQDHRN